VLSPRVKPALVVAEDFSVLDEALPGELAPLSAADNWDVAAHDETLGWGRHLLRERIDVVTLGEEHFSALQQPGVEELVRRLSALL